MAPLLFPMYGSFIGATKFHTQTQKNKETVDVKVSWVCKLDGFACATKVVL
jgi:hypothetical protein